MVIKVILANSNLANNNPATFQVLKQLTPFIFVANLKYADRMRTFVLSMICISSFFASLGVRASDSELSTTQAATIKIQNTADISRLEQFNRAMWYFNYEVMDKKFLRPIAYGYRDHVPQFVKSGTSNFLLNLNEPSNLVNHLLQTEWQLAANSSSRFLLNTTLGLAGLLDVAAQMGIQPQQDKFSDVLAEYGIANGPYFMLPFLGPKVARELSSDWVDFAYLPLNLLSVEQVAVKWALESLDARANLIPQEAWIDNALDPYAFTKQAYLQHLDYRLYGDQSAGLDMQDDLIDQYFDELD